MKKKIFLMLALALMLSCLFVISISAEVVTYNDAPARTNIEVRNDDLIVFDDGFTTLSAYVVKDDKTFGWKQNAYDFGFINGKTGAGYGYDNIVELDIPQGVTSVSTSAFASNNVIKRVSFPDSVTSIGGTMFEYSSSLEEFTFEHNANSELTTIPNWMFAYCTSLKAISFPDCVTKFTGVAQLGGCTNLTAIYLPKNLVSTEGGDNGNATFGNLTNGYFVNEPFTYDNIPEKPDVYYFPAGYYTATGETFDTCKNLNKVLVFSANNVTFENEWMFENVACDQNGTMPTIIFKGDVASIKAGVKWNVSAIYFANANDIDAASAGLISSKTVYFCHAEGNTQHLVEKAISTDATCESPKMTANYCFCGTIVGTPVTEGEALGHKYEGAVTYEFTSLVVGGKKCTACLNGCGTFEEETLKPIFDDYGYSVTTFSDKKALVNGYNVETSLLAIYENQNGVKVNFGFAFNRADNFTDGEVTLDSFAINAPINRNNGEIVFAAHEFRITYDSDEQLSANIIVAAYVVEIDAEGNEEASFINRTFDDGVNGFEAVSYNKFAQ